MLTVALAHRSAVSARLFPCRCGAPEGHMTVRHTGSGFPAVFCWRYSRVMSGDDDVVLMTLSGQPLASESELNVQISAPQNHTLILTDK